MVITGSPDIETDEFIIELKVAVSEEALERGKWYLRIFPEVAEFVLRDANQNLLAIIRRK